MLKLIMVKFGDSCELDSAESGRFPKVNGNVLAGYIKPHDFLTSSLIIYFSKENVCSMSWLRRLLVKENTDSAWSDVVLTDSLWEIQ
jgi:hypothetical protein